MKKALALIAAAALMATAGTAMATSIVDSKHNLSNYNPNNAARNISNPTGTQICVYCHTPHNGTGLLPLWNRNAPTTGAANFKLYSGVNMVNVSYKSGFTSDSLSLFCMSCHDGSPLAGSMIYNIPNSMPQNEKDALTYWNGAIGNVKTNISNYVAGKSLSNTHPVNFGVKTGNQLGAAGGADLATVSAGVKFTGQTMKSANNNGMEFPLYKSERSADSSFECSSCHAVHDNANSAFLRDTMANSKLCLGCHIK